jgi:hypothetical protein
VEGVEKPILNKGFIAVPDKPGLGITLNEAVVKQHLGEPGYTGLDAGPVERPAVELTGIPQEAAGRNPPEMAWQQLPAATGWASLV